MHLEIDTDVAEKPGVSSGPVTRTAALLRPIWLQLVRARTHVSPLLAWLCVVTTVVYVFLGHVSDTLGPDGSIEFVNPRATSGDEPHYLVIINSLLQDGDLRIDPDFARIQAGGYEAGIGWRGREFGGHSILVNHRTGKSVVCPEPCTDTAFAEVGRDPRDLAMYPAHPVGFPALMALLAWPFQPAPDQVESLVGRFAILISIAGVLVAYGASRGAGLSPRASVAAAGLLGFASSWLPYARSYFSESAIGLFILLAFLALRSGRPILAGLAVGATLMMKSVFVLFGVLWILERLSAKRYREAFWLAASIGACGMLQLGLNLLVLRSAVTIGSGTFFAAGGFQSLHDTLLQPVQGLLVFVPWAFIPFLWGLIALRRSGQEQPGRLDVDARRQLVPPLLAFLAVYSYIGWGPGYCYGPRYWVPLLPLLAIVVMDFVVAGKPWRSQFVGALACVSMFIAVPGAVKYRRLFIQPPAAAIFYPSHH